MGQSWSLSPILDFEAKLIYLFIKGIIKNVMEHVSVAAHLRLPRNLIHILDCLFCWMRLKVGKFQEFTVFVVFLFIDIDQ